MNTTLIIKCALATVGIVQLLKSFLGNISNAKWLRARAWVYALLTIFVGVLTTLLAYLAQPYVVDAMIVVSGASLFYDTIYKAFEKGFSYLASKAFNNGSIIEQAELK